MTFIRDCREMLLHLRSYFLATFAVADFLIGWVGFLQEEVGG